MGRKYKIRDNTYFYFVTFTVVHWIDIFTKESYRNILIDSIKYCQREKGLLVGAWCLMTNHAHLIISATEGNSISNIIRDLKSFTSRRIRNHLEYSTSESRKEWILELCKETGSKNIRNRDYQLWQQHNHPIVLSDNDMIDSRLNYIHQNPVKAGFVYNEEDWIYSSAIDYYGGKGLIDIYFLD